MLRRAMYVLAMLATAAATTAARAEGPGGTVSVTGEATVKVLPSALRVEIQLNCTNATLDAAMKQLNQRRETALEKLKTLKADATSIRASTPTVTKSAPVARYSSLVPRSITPGWDPYGPPTAVPPTVAPPDVGPPIVPTPLVPVPAPVAPPAPSAARAPDEVPAPAVAPPDRPYHAFPPSLAPVAPRPAACQLTEESSPSAALELVEEAAPEPPYRPSSTSPAVPPAGTYAPPAVAPAYPTYPMPAPAPAFPGNNWYSASTTVTAEWPLESTTIETLVAEVEKLQGKIAAADLPGERPTVTSAAGSGESAREAAPPRTAPARPAVSSTPAMAYPATTPSYTPPIPCPGAAPCSVAPAMYNAIPNVRCACVFRLSDRVRKAALAEAFANAKGQAAELAEAAGGKLGAVATLNRSVHFAARCPVNSSSGGYSTYAYPSSVAMDVSAHEATMTDPNEIHVQIQVQAHFRLE